MSSFFKSAFVVMMICVMCGCSRKVYVPVERERVEMVRDSVGMYRLSRDTVVVLDSVVVERRGDTVYHSAWRTRYRVRERVDTLRVVSRDTVCMREPVVVPVQEEKGKNSGNLWGFVIAGVIVIGLIRLMVLIRPTSVR